MHGWVCKPFNRIILLFSSAKIERGECFADFFSGGSCTKGQSKVVCFVLYTDSMVNGITFDALDEGSTAGGRDAAHHLLKVEVAVAVLVEGREEATRYREFVAALHLDCRPFESPPSTMASSIKGGIKEAGLFEMGITTSIVHPPLKRPQQAPPESFFFVVITRIIAMTTLKTCSNSQLRRHRMFK